MTPKIQLAMEAPYQQGSLPFLDTLVSVGTHGSLITTVYMDHIYIGPRLFAQPTITGTRTTYLDCLSRCNYPDWVFHRLQTKLDCQLSLQHHNNSLYTHKDINKTTDSFIVVPCSRGVSESFKNVCVKAGVQVHFKGGNTIKDLLVAPKDRESITNKGGVIYRCKCDHPVYTMEYICETYRKFGDRYSEHLGAPSLIYDHANTTGHTIKLDNFSTVDRESQGITRTIRDAMFISQHSPLNRNLGKYQLPLIWEGVLQDMLALHLQ